MSRPKTIKSTKRNCDRFWAKIIRSRFPKCVRCGKPTTEAHHIWGRRCMSTRFDLDNGVGLCAYCHKFDKYGFEQDGQSKENKAILIGILGKKRYDELEVRHNKSKKYTLDELIKLEGKLKSML